MRATNARRDVNLDISVCVRGEKATDPKVKTSFAVVLYLGIFFSEFAK